MSDQPQPGYRPQPTPMSSPAWSQVTNYLGQQSGVFIFMLVVAALFIAYNLAERQERSNAHTSRSRNVPPESQEGQQQS